MNGASEFEIAAQLGHANLQTTKRYVHFAKEHLRAKADIIGADRHVREVPTAAMR